MGRLDVQGTGGTVSFSTKIFPAKIFQVLIFRGVPLLCKFTS